MRSAFIFFLILLSFILSGSVAYAELPDFARPLPIEPELLRPSAPEGMVFIKGGCFEMGDIFGDGENDERPVHNVCLDNFYMGKYEVTEGEFHEFIKETGYQTEAERGDGCVIWTGREWKKEKARSWRNPGFTQTEQSPVVCVSFSDATEYTKWKSRKSGRNYRLPTEAEWEYAARSGGKDYKYSWGNGTPSGNIGDEAAKKAFSDWIIWTGYDDRYIYTSPVGSFKPTELGLYDMTGNAWEWVEDWYEVEYYKISPKENPKGPSTGQYKVLRGGSWNGRPGDVRVAYRIWRGADARQPNAGFRLALSLSSR